MTEAALKRHQFEVGDPNESFLAEPSPVPDANLQVSGGRFVQEDGVTLDEAAAKSVGPFGVFTGTTPNVERWDLVTLDPSGPVFVIVSTPGTDQPAGSFKTSVPPIPTNHIPVAAVRITEAGTVVITGSDIVDVRNFYHSADKDLSTTSVIPLPLDPDNASGSAGTGTDLSREDHVHPHGDLGTGPASANRHHKTEQSEHTQATPGDWAVADPATDKASLDELAGRLNTASVPVALDASTGLAGTDLDASHVDHVHPHGDVRATVTPHHDSDQVHHTQVDTDDWETADAAVARLHLDELAARAPFGNRFSRLEIAGPNVTADQVRLHDFIGWVSPQPDDVLTGIGQRKFISLGAALTADLSDTGAGGLDTGSPAVNTWYWVHIITDPAGGNPALVLSAAQGAPSFGAIGGVYDPGGLFKHVGFAKTPTGSSTAFLVAFMSGNEYAFIEDDGDLAISTGFPGASFANVSAANGIPPWPSPTNAFILGKFVTFGRELGGGGPDEVFAAPGGTTGSSGGKRVLSIQSGGDRADQMHYFEMMTDTSRQIAHRGVGAGPGYELRVVGFHIPIF